MVSHIHKCIFIHIPKVAGISVEQVFLESLGLDYTNRYSLLLGINQNKDLGPKRLSHLTAKEYVELHFLSQELFDNYYKFSFVRNPYDRLYSFYKYLGYSELISLEKFILNYLPKLFKDNSLQYFIKPMYHYIYNEKEERIVDFVGKLETINQDFKIVANNLNLERKKIRNLNTSNNIGKKTIARRLYRIIIRYPQIIFHLSFGKNSKKKFFNSKMKQVIQKYYYLDFIYFDYLP